MRETGSPLESPNFGFWRISGAATLQVYYQSIIGAFHVFSSWYQPVLGDVAYDSDGIFGQHTNIVLKNDNGKIYVFTNEDTDAARIVEYGVVLAYNIRTFKRLNPLVFIE